MRTYPDSSPWVKPIITLVLALLVGAGLGVATAVLTSQVFVALVGVTALAAVWWLVKIPALTVLTFLLGYTLQRSVLYGSSIEGLYYPIYALMFLNIFLLVISRRFTLPVQLASLYFSFYFVALLGLFNLYSEWDRNITQQLFVYGLGLLVFLQFKTRKSFYVVYWGQALLSLYISAWTISTALQGGLTWRGGISGDQNNVSLIIILGMLPLVTTIFAERTVSSMVKLLSWLGLGVGMYALFILASRGMTSAFVFTLVALGARAFRSPKRVLSILLGASLITLTLMQLPGTNILFERFSETDDVAAAGGRVQLWGISLDIVRESEPTKLVLGHGFRASRVLVGQGTVAGTEESTHNSYLQMLIDFGIVGLGFFLALHAAALRLLWARSDTLSLYASGCVVFLLLSALTLNLADNFLYWIFLGYALAVAYFQKPVEPAQFSTKPVSADNTHLLHK